MKEKVYFAGVIVSTGDNTGMDPVLPGSLFVSSIATEPATAAASDQIFSWNVSFHFTIGVNANTIRHSFDSSKSLKEIGQ